MTYVIVVIFGVFLFCTLMSDGDKGDWFGMIAEFCLKFCIAALIGWVILGVL